MQTWACGHEGEEGHSRLCPHLVGAGDACHARVLRGKRLKADLCCSDCAALVKKGKTIEWASVCKPCVEILDEDETDLIEWIGKAGIEERPTTFNSTLLETTIPEDIAWAVAAAPLDTRRFLGFWKKTLFLIDEEAITPICGCAAPLPYERDEGWCGHHLAPHIYISEDERFAAVVNDYGRYGLVVDLQEKRITMNLDKGGYRNEHAPFPAGFFVHDGRTLFVHATEWNRLDVSDPADGTLMTERDFATARDCPTSPGVYWHGRLTISPDSQWIADDKWAWGPVGVVSVWNLSQWLENNVWESERGSTYRWVSGGNYLWDIPVAWVDNERVAVWGLGPDDEIMLDAAIIFDVNRDEETATFAGPRKNAFFGGDGRLFSVEDDGLHIWDAATGERLGRIDGFKPKWQRGDYLIELKDDRVLKNNRVRSWNWRTAFD